MADLQTALSYFLNDLYAGTLGVTNPISKILVGDGTAGAPALAFSSESTLGLYRLSSGKAVLAGGALSLGFNGTGNMLFNPSNGQYTMGSTGTLNWTSGTEVNAIDVSLSRGAAGTLTLNSGTATPAGGSTALRLVFGSTSGFGVYVGSGAPTVSAAQGSLYLRSDGSSTSTRLYVNTNGSTTWTSCTTAA